MTSVLSRAGIGLCLVLVMLLTGCDEGAVVFAPTPLPPDMSPLRYEHPSGAFSIILPRDWSVYAQNTETLASAYFTSPGAEIPALSVTVVNLDTVPVLVDIINAYQSEIRPDARQYTELERQPMGDGSWRFSGLRVTEGGLPQPVNTFITLTNSWLSVADLALPPNTQQVSQLESLLNTLQINTSANLESTALATLATSAHAALEIVNVSTWSTPQGVYFITGEVANHSNLLIPQLPIRAELQTLDRTGIAEAPDMVMGYGIPPGGFAPFSLRFGQGQPEGTTQYVLTLGKAAEQGIDAIIYSEDAMTWTDERNSTPEGHLLISGRVTNTSSLTLRDPVAVVTVFDASQNVIAAGFTPILEGEFEPEASTAFNIRVPEMGGEVANHIVNVQALSGE